LTYSPVSSRGPGAGKSGLATLIFTFATPETQLNQTFRIQIPLIEGVKRWLVARPAQTGLQLPAA
jgi:hypothetical protein